MGGSFRLTEAPSQARIQPESSTDLQKQKVCDAVVQVTFFLSNATEADYVAPLLAGDTASHWTRLGHGDVTPLAERYSLRCQLSCADREGESHE